MRSPSTSPPRRLGASASLAAAALAALVTLLPSLAFGEGAATSQAQDPARVVVRYGDGPDRVVQVPPGLDARSFSRRLQRDPAVAYAAPDFQARAAGAAQELWWPDDPGKPTRDRLDRGDWRKAQWNFLGCTTICAAQPSGAVSPYESFGGVDAIGAWRWFRKQGRRPGAGARVAVLDSGIAYRRLGRGFRRSPDFLASQFAPGRDLVDGDRKPLDLSGHGTHVAGTIGAQVDNGVSVTGLAPGAKLIPVRVLRPDERGDASAIAKGIWFAAKRGADVINMSFEFPPSSGVRSCADIPSVCRALRYAVSKGALPVAATGNLSGSSPKAPVAFPAAWPGVLAVGASTPGGCLAGYSRIGDQLDLLAPGGGLPSASVDCRGDGLDDPDRGIVQLTLDLRRGYRSFGYPLYEGTSMSAAHASGAAALVISSGVLGAGATPERIVCQLAGTARTEGLGETLTARRFGAGILDASRAVRSRADGC